MDDVALEFLSELERREAELLAWGVVDGYFSLDELEQYAQEYLDARVPGDPRSIDDLLAQLEDATLLWKVPGSSERFRTRMAEGIRLLSRLRQILHWRAWDAAQNLIADYRLLLAPRTYPKRHLTPDQVRTAINEVDGLSQSDRAIVNRLLGVDSPTTFLLAGFQLDAARRVLRELSTKRSSGTIVCAGTGSGKTLAFYLPALLSLGRWVDANRWTRCLALYPRNELLKDQLNSAVQQTMRLNEVLHHQGKRGVVVGALFGSIPKDVNHAQTSMGRGSLKNWTRLGSGWCCPYLSCPTCGERQLVWTHDHIAQGVEELTCAQPGCGAEVGAGLFVLTRKAMIDAPPDLLFTSLEMVNQRMSDPRLGRLLGLGGLPTKQRPRLVLLDEVHTYEGVAGAQASVLLRRWRHASGASPHFVGLSATLADAQRFFADFISVRPSLVRELSPRSEDMEPLGQQYMLAVRGDPISQTNLLSATIQVSMLLRRLLDVRGDGGAFGEKLFAFTDNLDVINRLFHTLMDAEGWRLGRNGQRQANRPNQRNAAISEPWLAAYRASNRDSRNLRWQLGQSWDLCESIGHRLVGDNPPVPVGRTSSQDAGVDADAEIVVATASLEVGYDDPDVGAIVQHKAPQSAAAFLQRKGRAGRQRHMRPWTVVVLSCFGRDRIAYEGYEQLFSPELKPRHLPTANRYVLRMQATYALMDWLSSQGVDGHIWQLLSGPPSNAYSRRKVEQIHAIILRVLDSESARRRMASYLRAALRIDDETLHMVMWEPPRSLMLSVLPTLARRLERRWLRATTPGAPKVEEPHVFWSPLPEFVPQNLFSDLNLPEVQILLPGDHVEAMPILQALREFSPGRVSLRFGVRSRHARHWIPVPAVATPTEVAIDAFCPPGARDELGTWPYIDENDDRRLVRVVRPFALAVSEPEQEVGQSSNARLVWKSMVIAPSVGTSAELPKTSPWTAVVDAVEFYTHANGSPMEVRRFALGSDFLLKRRGEDDIDGSVRFCDGADDGAAVALGFSMDVDGIRIRISIPTGLHEKACSDPRLLRGLRVSRFRHLLDEHQATSTTTNVFQRQWLTTIYLAALVLLADRDSLELPQAHVAIADRNQQPLEEVLDVLFRSLGNTEEDRRDELRDIIRSGSFWQAVEDSAPCLWETPGPEWEEWMRQRYLTTMGAAFRDAAQALCPDLDANDLCPDIHAGAVPQPDALWLTETTIGGGGFVEALFHAYSEDPRRFLDLLDAALSPSDFEDIHSELSLVLRWAGEDSERGERVRSAMHQVRSATGHSGMVAAQARLRRQLSSYGLRTTHAVITALQARVLRPGSSQSTDVLLSTLVQRWETLETRLGIEVSAQVVAYLNSASDDLDTALAGLTGATRPTQVEQWRFDTLYGLLWPRGAAVRAQALQAYNPYSPLPETDRLLVLATLTRARRDIKLEQNHWLPLLQSALLTDGIATLSVGLEGRALLADAIHHLMLEPLDLGHLLAYPRLRGLTQEADRLAVVVELAEVIQ